MPSFPNTITRSINEKLGEVISLLDFGADASGVVDSSAAFSKAIAAADSVAGCAIHIPRGTYTLASAVEIAAGVDAITLYGDGSATILKRGAAMAAGKGLLNISGTDIVLRNLAIEGDVLTPAGKRYGTMIGENGGDDPMHADLTRNTSIWIHPGAKRVRLENITIRHTGGYSVLIDARTADVEDVSIDSCRVEQCRPHLFGVSDGDLNYGSWTGGIHYQGDCRVAAPYGVKGLSVVDCSFDRVNGACVWGHSYGFAAHHQNVTVRNCRFSYVGFHCVGFGNVLGGTNTGNTGHHVGHVHYTDSDTPVAKVLTGAFSVCLDTAGWCENLVYTGNSFNEIAGQGSDLDGLRKGVITGNSFIGSASASYGLKGIQTGATFDPGAGCDIIVANNHLENFWYGAVVLPQAQRCTVRGNHIQHPSDAAVAPISLLPLDCQASGGGPAVCTDNVVTGNDITYSGSLFCVVEDQSAAFESADRNLVCGNTLHGTNAGEFKKHASSASSSRVTDTFLAIGADRYTAAEANQYPATVALLAQSSGRMRISTSVQSGARVWENVLTDANPSAIPSSFVIPKSATQDLGGQLVLKGGDKSGGGQWQDVALDNTQGYLRIWGSGSGNSCNLLLYGTDNQASLTVSHGYISSAQGFYTDSVQYNALQLTAGGAAVKGLRISTNQSGATYASGGYLALGRDNFTTPVALSGEDLSTKFTLHYRYTTGVEDAIRFMFGGVLRMQLSSAGNLVFPGADQGEVIKVTDGYIYSGDGFYTPSSNTDCLKAPAGGVMVQHVRVTDGSVEKAGFRYSGGKLQWSSDLSNWNDFAVSISGVTALNSLTGALSITAGTGVTISPSSPNIQVSIGQSVATTAAVTFASLNPGIVFRKENSTDEGGSFNLESPNTDNYPTLYVDNFQGYVRFIGTKNAANHCPMQVWGKAGVAGLDVLAGWVQSAGGFATTSTSATAVNVTGAGGGIFADYLTADEFVKLTSKSAAPTAISGSYGGLAHKSGSAYWYWTGSAWAEANLAALLPSGTSGQTLRHDGTSWAASSVIFNNGTNVGIGTATPGSYKLSVSGGSVLISASDGISGVLALAGHGWVGSVDWGNLTLVAGTNSGNAGIYFQTEGSQRMSIGGNGAVVMTGASGAAGLTVTAGWMQCAGGFLTSGTAADIINAASGGVTSRYLVLSASAGTPNLSIQEGAAPALPSSGWSRLYMDSSTHKLMASENGAAAVALLSSLPSGTSGQTLRHDGSSWVASSILQNDGTNCRVTGRFAVGTLAGSPSYLLDIRSSGAGSQIHVSSSDADSGGYFVSNAAHAIAMSAGAAYDGLLGWVAKSSLASIFNTGGGRIDLYTDSGLTSGSVFNPTRRFVLYPSGGLAFGNSVVYTDPGDSNIVTAGWISATGGFATTGVATNIINAASGGVTAKWLIGTTSFTLAGETAANAGLSDAGRGRLYFDSTANKFKVSENGGAYVDLVPGSSLPSGTTGQTLRHNGSAWVASSELTNDGSTVIVNGPAWQQYRYGVAGNVALMHARGSVGSPTTTQSGDEMGIISTRGYGATGYSGTGNTRVVGTAEETFTNTAFGSRLSFWTTPIGSTSNTEKMRITGGGNVLIGTTDDDGTPATGRLVVKGSTANGTSHIFVGRDSSEVNVLTLDTDGNLNASGTGVFGGASGAAGLTVSAGWVQCAGGYQTTGTAADILNAASGGLTSRYVVLSAAAGTPNLSIQGVATANAPAAPATGWSRIYMDSTTGKLRVSENGAAYVDLVGTGGSLPSGTSGQTLRHNGTSWVASSVFTNDGSPKITRAGQSHLYFTSAAGTGGFLIGRSYASGDANDFFIYDLTASAKRFGIDSAGSVTAAGSLQAYRVIESRGGLGSRQSYEMSDVNEMRDVGFYAAGASTSNKPSGASSYGAVLVNNYYPNTRGQLYMNTQPGSVPYIWARASATWSDDNQWQAWVRVLVEDYNGDVSVTRKLTAGSDIITSGGRFFCDVASQPALTLKQSGTVRAAFFYDESDAKTKIARYSDAGGYVGSAVAITRATGDVALERALTIAGVAGAAGLTISAGWVQCPGGYQTTGTATDIINAASGGVTSRYLVLSAAAGTPNLSLQEGAAPALPSSGWSRFYMDSGTHKLMMSQNGAAAVGLLDRLTSINSQTGPTITLQGYTNEIAVSTASTNTIQVRLATNIEAQGTVRLVGGHLYLANNYSINFRDTGGTDRIAITRASDNHLYIDNVDNNGDIYLRPANGRYVIVGQGSSSNAYLIPNTAGGTNSVGTSTYPWDEVNSATYKYGNTLLINSSGQFVGLGVAMQSYACGASGFNCYSGGAWKYGRTVTLYDRDGNAMNFYGGILAS